MIVVTFDPDKYNFVVAGDDAYFLLRLPGGGRVLFKDRCAHRGGPLHLGGWDACAGALVCPSHQTRYSEGVLRRQGAPLVYRGGLVTAVLDVSTRDEIRFAWKQILAQPVGREN
jgi:hypothetical protein